MLPRKAFESSLEAPKHLMVLSSSGVSPKTIYASSVNIVGLFKWRTKRESSG